MGKKIIVIDDSQTIREQVGTTLRNAGFDIVEAVDGVDGGDVIARTPDAALVICDVNMPNRGGLELLEGLRKEDKLKAAPRPDAHDGGAAAAHRACAEERREGVAREALQGRPAPRGGQEADVMSALENIARIDSRRRVRGARSLRSRTASSSESCRAEATEAPRRPRHRGEHRFHLASSAGRHSDDDA